MHSRSIAQFLIVVAIVLWASSPLHAGRISPRKLWQAIAAGSADTASNPRIADYHPLLSQIQSRDPLSPPTILGAVHIGPDQADGSPIAVRLILARVPGSRLEVVAPNATASAWATTELGATVSADGLTATIETVDPGVYALYNPDWVRTRIASRMAATAVPPHRAVTASTDWGLFLENSSSADKIPLILVHGDNSYKEEQARWGDFLKWATDTPSFNNRYEIWRFNHDTRLPIGFDGQGGNAAQLGEAIVAQFDSQRPILLLAHSRGGLVSRAYMNAYGDGNQGDRVLGLVALATPHHGSPGAVPEWGLLTVQGAFRDTDLAELLYGRSADKVVDVSDVGTMGLAWDNFDGPQNGIDYRPFSLASSLGSDHVLSVMDANLADPQLEAGQHDPSIYLPDRALGTLAAMNRDRRYFGKIIAFGGYDTDLGVGGQDPFDWLGFSFSDHAGLVMATHLMANMASKGADGSQVYHYMANDGMVPLQSALLLSKSSTDEPIYTVEKDRELIFIDTLAITLKDLADRMQFRKAVLCPDYDHLHMVEAKGGLMADKSDYWEEVAASLDELAQLSADETTDFTPEVVELSDSMPGLSDLIAGDNCFIDSLTPTLQKSERFRAAAARGKP